MNQDNKKGFTLIELMLAMTFISVLLVAIAMTTIQISTIYTKGITLREVDQAGRSVSDELQRSIASSAPFDVTKPLGDPLAKYINVANQGGRLCLGQYSYVWNYGKAFAQGGTVLNTYSDGTPVNFAKIADPSGALCVAGASSVLPSPSKDDASDLLTSGDRDLVLHSFSITETTSDAATSQALYAISMTIGTNDREQLTVDDASCKPPSENIGDESYCSVNQFDIIARAGNQAEGQ